MATLNFTNSLIRPVFSFFGFPDQHEKISCSSDLFLSPENFSALQMLNKTFSFRYKNEEKNLLFPLGRCVVVTVVFNADNGPEIGLLSDSCHFVDIIPLVDLVVQYEVVKTHRL